MLRGFAALAVVISHATIVGLHQPPLWDLLKWTPLRILWSGHQAVILFFTLSGFALTRMLDDSQKPMSYLNFFWGRITRLYPPYIASIVFALVVYQGLQAMGHQWAGGWMNTVSPTLDVKNLVQHVLLIPSFDTGTINPPIWSIMHEMRLSLIFPVLLLVVRKAGLYALSAFVLCSVAIGITSLSGIAPESIYPRHGLLLTLHYASFFVLGIIISRYAQALKRRTTKLSHRRRFSFWAIGIILYAYPFESSWSTGARILGDLFIGMGTAIIMALSLDLADSRIKRVGVWLGRISYSLYLNHYLVLGAAIILLYVGFGALSVWLIALPLSIVFAYILYWGIEHPTILAARKLRQVKHNHYPVSSSH